MAVGDLKANSFAFTFPSDGRNVVKVIVKKSASMAEPKETLENRFRFDPDLA